MRSHYGLCGGRSWYARYFQFMRRQTGLCALISIYAPSAFLQSQATHNLLSINRKSDVKFTTLANFAFGPDFSTMGLDYFLCDG